MLFSSVVFLFLFLPTVLALYYLLPKSFKNLFLVIASLFFYSWGEGKIVLVMLASVLVDYSCGILIASGKRRLGLIISIVTNLAFLGFFKYFNFAFENLHLFSQWMGYQGEFFDHLPLIALPIGISFYTFQTMSYTIDIYRGEVKANRNIIDFAAYVTLFPQLVAGPIVRYKDVYLQLENRTNNFSNFSIGVERFIKGLAKKILIANSCGYVADLVFAQTTSDLSSIHAWIGIIAYSFQIFFDFSGYSDMAIGLGKMFGFNFPENFNFPYIAKNIRDFWRRWHISLSTWFRDYLYISLGGNKKGNTRTYVNLILVFFITGLWHGASWSFIVWGLFHGLFITIERLGFDKILKKTGLVFQHFYTLLVVIIAWVFFRADTLAEAFDYLKVMFSFSEGDPSANSYLSFFNFNAEHAFVLLVALILSTPIAAKVKKGYPTLVHKLTYVKPIFLLTLFIISITYIVSGAYNPFIYFRF